MSDTQVFTSDEADKFIVAMQGMMERAEQVRLEQFRDEVIEKVTLDKIASNGLEVTIRKVRNGDSRDVDVLLYLRFNQGESVRLDMRIPAGVIAESRHDIQCLVRYVRTKLAAVIADNILLDVLREAQT